MTEFKTISIVKFPVEASWHTMMHHLPKLAEEIDDIESIIQKNKAESQANATQVVNEWNAKPQLPQIVLQFIKPGMLSWTDTAAWKEKDRTVSWEIESHYFKEGMACTGETTYEPAMGGKGCRITFSGKLDMKPGALSIGGDLLSGTLSKTVEGVIAQLIPTNFKKITKSLENYIEKNGAEK